MSQTLVAYLPQILTLVAAGLVAGFAAGLFGIGGGAVIVPVLFFLLDAAGFGDTAMHVAISTSLATIILTSLRSVAAHHAQGAVDWPVIRAWSPWIMAGALAGVAVSGFLSKQALLGVFGTLAILLAAQLIFGRPAWRLAPAMPRGAPRAGLGLGVGALSAVMGIGGGTFGVTLMTLYGMPIHRAVATAAGWGAAIGVPGALAAIVTGWGREGLPPLSAGFVNLPAFAVISVFTVLMAPVGSRFAHRLDANRLRRLFGALLGVIALRMIWQAAGL